MQNSNKDNGNNGLFSIYDTKTASYTPPMAFQNNEVAKRAIVMTMLQNPQAPFAVFPADYVLLKIAEWNPSLGIVPIPVPESLGMLVEIISAYRAANKVVNMEEKQDDEQPSA